MKTIMNLEGNAMKKLLALALVAALALFLLTACKTTVTTQSGGGTSSKAAGSASDPPASPDGKTESAPSETPDKGGEQATPSLISWMMGGTFSYDFTMTGESAGMKVESSGSMAVDGEKFAMRQEMTAEGMNIKTRMIKKDGKMYTIDDEHKVIMEMSVGTNQTQGTMTDYTGIKKTGGGIGEIGGKTLPYEEYAAGETGGTVRYYIDGGQVYGIESQVEGYKAVMIITNPSNSVPAGAFDLPEGYSSMGAFDAAGGMDISKYLPEDFDMSDIELPEGVTLPEGFKMP